MNVTAETARRFLVARQALAPARSIDGGTNAVEEVVRRLGLIQFDPLAVAGRNHDLVLHARVTDYDPAWCEELLYGRRELFEAYNKSLCLLPTRELPWFRTSLSVTARQLLKDHAEVADRVLERIRAEGPLSSLDFEREPAIDWQWAPTNAIRAVLEASWMTGVLGIARREGNRRYFDLIERLFPPELLAREVPLREQLRHRLLSRYRAHGLLGTGGSGEMWMGLGPARPDPKRPELPGRSVLHTELVEQGELVRVVVEGVKGPRFVLRGEVALLTSPPDPPPAVAFLAPLDAPVWDRALLRALFGFDYVWEVYVPEPKRRWGYYVLPVLFRDRLVGRIEPRIDRRGGRVDVLGLWWEAEFDPRRAEGFVEAMREALRAYCRFGRATRLTWASHLGTERRRFGVRP